MTIKRIILVLVVAALTASMAQAVELVSSADGYVKSKTPGNAYTMDLNTGNGTQDITYRSRVKWNLTGQEKPTTLATVSLAWGWAVPESYKTVLLH